MDRAYFDSLKLPETPGVYIFKGPGKKILYIGKATSLRDRVRSYFARDLDVTRGGGIVGMVAEAKTLEWEETPSVLEALILEANLIKRHQPPYNVLEKSNTSFNYLIITKEAFPRVLVVRGRELFQKWKDSEIKYTFGPFPQGSSLKEAVKLVRKIFPFRDSCTPLSRKPCFNAQIGLCPGVCVGITSATEYAKTIRSIKELFSAQFHGLKTRLQKEMSTASKSEDFETAEKLRRQVSALTHIRDVSLIKDEYRAAPGGGVRIEAYDVAHTAGSETVGVMVVVNNGEAAKEEYRKFKIQTATNNDAASLGEMLERRLKHTDWTYPKIIVVDGGTSQFRKATSILRKSGIQIPVVGVVKNESHRPERLIGDTKAISAHEKDILLANSEAHRFAIGWHRKRLRKSMI